MYYGALFDYLFSLYLQFNISVISVNIMYYYLSALYFCLYISLFVHRCIPVYFYTFFVISMCDMCLCYIHCLCVMSNLVRPVVGAHKTFLNVLQVSKVLATR